MMCLTLFVWFFLFMIGAVIFLLALTVAVDLIRDMIKQARKLWASMRGR